MAIEIAAWNVKDGFSDPDRIPVLRAAIDRHRPDVMVFSEAYAAAATAQLDNVFEDFDKRDYAFGHTLYEDDDARKDRHGLIVIASKELLSGPFAALRLASRYALQAWLTDPATEEAVSFTGAHFDDRSEDRRLGMVQALKPHIAPEGMVLEPVVLAGDLNSMHRTDPLARKLRTLRPLRPLLKLLSIEPDPTNPIGGVRRKASLAYRLTDMATGKTMAELESWGLRDADPGHVPTIPAEKPTAQLDHVLVSRRIHVVRYDVMDYNAAADHGIYQPVSDHRGIAATLAITREPR